MSFKNIFQWPINNLRKEGIAAGFLTALILHYNIIYSLTTGIILAVIISKVKNRGKINYCFLSKTKKNNIEIFKSSKKVNFQETENKNNDYIIINLSGKLYFNSASNLEDLFQKVYQEQKTIIIRMSEIQCMDTTIMKKLSDFIEKVKNNNRQIILTGVKENIYNQFKLFGLIKKIGIENIYKQSQFHKAI